VAALIPLISLILLSALALNPIGHTIQAQQDAPLSLSVEAGYDGYFRAGDWSPVRVNVTNNGPDVQGELRVFATDLFGAPADVYATPIDLPTRSSKQVFLYIPLNDLAQEIRVELVRDDQVLISVARTMRASRSGDMLFALLTDTLRGGIDLTVVRTGVGETRQANWRTENVPPRGVALRGLDALVLIDADTGALTVEQREAIADWVAGGGHLVVAGGPSWQKTRAGLSELLPLQPTGTTTLTSLPAVAAFAGRPADRLEAQGSAIVVAVGDVLPGASILIEESGLPILVRHAIGAGIVDYLTIDPGLEPIPAWTERNQFWFTLLTTSGQRPTWSRGITGTVQAQVAADYVSGLRLPDVFQLSAFLIVYVLLVGPVNYLFLRRLRRRELAWITIPLIVIGASALYYLTGFNLRGTQAIVNRLALVQVWPDGSRAQVDGVIGLLAPRRGTYDLQVQPGFALRVLTSEQFVRIGATSGITVVETGQAAARSVLIDAGTTVAFATTGYINAAPLEGNATILLSEESPMSSSAAVPIGIATEVMPPRITGQVRNTTGMTLHDAVALALGSATPIGTLAPGESRAFEIALRTDQAPPLWIGDPSLIAATIPRSSRVGALRPDMTIRHILGDTYMINRPLFAGRGFETTPERQRLWRRQLFLQSVATDLDPSGGRGTDVFIAGWAEESPLEVTLADTPFLQEDTTLYIYRLPVTVETVSDSGMAEVPSAYLSWTASEPSGRRDISPYDVRIQLTDSFTFRFTPMPLMALTDVAEIRLVTQAGNSASIGRGAFALWDWRAGSWETVGITPPLTRITNDPARFIGPGGAVEVRVEAGASNTSLYYERIDIRLYGRLAAASPQG
jgi:hypothetical protein